MEKNIFYHDQEGRLVQVLSQAVMRESGRAVILYQELFGGYLRKVEYRDVFLDSMSVFDGEFSRDERPVLPSRVKDSGEKRAFGTAGNAKTDGDTEANGLPEGDMKTAAEGNPDVKGNSDEEESPNAEDAYSAEGGTPQELLMEFLDAQTNSEKLEILYQMKDCVTDYLIDTMALSLDMEIPQGVLEDRYQKLIRSLRTVMKYEANRLR